MNPFLKKSINLFLLPATLLCASLFVAGCTSKKNLGNKIVLDVNGDRWTAEDFSKELVFRLRNENAIHVKDPKSLKGTKDAITKDFIVQSLSAQWARKKGLLVKAEDLEAEIGKVKKSYPDDLSFKASLAEQGLTFKDWKRRMEQTMVQKLVVSALTKDIEKPSANEIKSFYNAHREQFSRKETVQLRHILLPLKRDAKLIEQELKKGSTITKIANILNEKGGESIKPEVFWIEKGESPIFASAFKMPIGRRSPVIKSEFGFHIFELIGKKYARSEPLSRVKDQIEQELMQEEQQKLYTKWLDEQIRKARIFKDSDLIESLRIETKEY
ncbi:MAG TPA: hypothetical protein DEQ51_02855 [Alphaproteobacteria bacterium]|nr:hypothetical protein [Pseudobdellovibrionaceae bacterium]HCD63451.1 hypothetical protein [Alphaproteobacteria bacterium]|tara:strand:+ start:66 stop:1049 length:984 start_codon:yes stop_codon:yes gene_type:complete